MVVLKIKILRLDAELFNSAFTFELVADPFKLTFKVVTELVNSGKEDDTAAATASRPEGRTQ